jgi:hypothetical protein
MPDVANGAYYVLACADVGRKIRERREGNNCQAIRVTKTTTVRVTAVTPPIICEDYAARVTLTVPFLYETVEEVYLDAQPPQSTRKSFGNLTQAAGQVAVTLDFQGAPGATYDVTVRDGNFRNLAFPKAGGLRTVPCLDGPLTGSMTLSDTSLPPGGGTIQVNAPSGTFQSGSRVVLAQDANGNAFDAATTFDSSSQLTAVIPAGQPAYAVFVINPDGTAGDAGSVFLF